jgi:hypothetical protein
MVALLGCSTQFFTAKARADDVTAAISARACSDYARVRLSDGTFQPETYVFARVVFGMGHPTGPSTI